MLDKCANVQMCECANCHPCLLRFYYKINLLDNSLTPKSKNVQHAQC